MGMDTLPGSKPMENPPHDPLAGLDPADLLRQGAAEDTFASAAAFQPPSLEELTAIFPQFEILELIGKGGMGAVYKVRQKDLDRIVALKILPPAIGQSPEFSNRFTREARALAKLNHPGIVTLHEFGQASSHQPSTLNHPPLPYILMEFVAGVNLAQLMKSGRISPREALAIVPQICDALQYAHDQGIVHRDIKPENILLDRLGRVKVADFGIAKVVAAVCDRPAEEEGNQRRSQTDATLAGKINGTPRYMAPEQFDHPAEVDHRADIYALGVVFYQMLTGDLPGKSLEAPSRKVQIDVRLDEIVLKAMEKDPELRYQQASVMRTRVEDLGVEQPNIIPIPSAAQVETRCDSFALAAFLMAILLGPLGSLPAIIFGHVSFSRIRANRLLTGRGFAMAGVIIGYLFLAASIALIAVAMVFHGKTTESGFLSSSGEMPFPTPRAIVIEEPPSPPSSSSVNPTLLMTEFGEFKSEQSLWSIRVSAQDRTLHISRQPGSGGIGISISPSKWIAQNGWFAFIEDEHHAWAYDGSGKLMLAEVTPEKSTLYETEMIPRRVPSAILPRISQSTREMIGTKAGKMKEAETPAATPSLQERLLEMEIAALVARKKFPATAPEFKQAAMQVTEFAGANPSARDVRWYGEALDQRRKLLITLSKELAGRYGPQHPEVAENRQELEAVEQIIRTRMYVVVFTPDVSQAAQMKFHFDCAGDTMQQVLMRLGKQFNVRICWESDEKIWRGRMEPVMMKDLLEELEIREASGRLSDREKERLVELRRFQIPETAGEVFTRYQGELAASSLEGLLDQLTKGTTDRARKSKSGKTWMISPIEGSRLEFPVTLNTRDLTIAQAVDQLCSQSPDKLERTSDGERPWLDMACKPVSFHQEPAWEALCRISEEAEFDLIWEAIPDLVINPSYSSVAGYFAQARKQTSAQSPGNHSSGPSPAESFVELELGVARARESYLNGDPVRSEAEEKLNAFIAKNPDFPNEASRQIVARRQVDLLAEINDLSLEYGPGHPKIVELNHKMDRLAKLPEIGVKQIEIEAAERILSRDLPPANRLEIRLEAPGDPEAEVVKIEREAGETQEIRVSHDVIVCDRHIMEAGLTQEDNAGTLDITLNEVGAKRLGEATKSGHGTLRLAIMIDGKVEIAPVFNSQLGKTLQISERKNYREYVDLLQSFPIWDDQKNSLEAANWLKGIDDGKYPESHATSSKVLRERLSEKAWEAMLTRVRKPLGNVTSRGLKKYSEVKAVDGSDYRLILFDTQFSNLRNAVETVTFMKEKDGDWKAVGYFVR